MSSFGCRIQWKINGFHLLGELLHGANIPKWNGIYRDQYIDKTKDDKNFYDLNESIKLWVISTIGSIPGTGPKEL